MIIVGCGSRHAEGIGLIQRYSASIRERINWWVKEYGQKLVLVEGGQTGVDTLVKKFAHARGVGVAEVPALWAFYGKAAGPIRNGWMTLLKPDLVVGWHHDYKTAKGTTSMLKLAKDAGIETLRLRV